MFSTADLELILVELGKTSQGVLLSGYLVWSWNRGFLWCFVHFWVNFGRIFDVSGSHVSFGVFSTGREGSGVFQEVLDM